MGEVGVWRPNSALTLCFLAQNLVLKLKHTLMCAQKIGGKKNEKCVIVCNFGFFLNGFSPRVRNGGSCGSCKPCYSGEMGLNRWRRCLYHIRWPHHADCSSRWNSLWNLGVWRFKRLQVHLPLGAQSARKSAIHRLCHCFSWRLELFRIQQLWQPFSLR